MPEPMNGVDRRRTLVAALVAQTGIDEALISALVSRFYADVRADALLGPIFAEHVHDWDGHLALLADFWSGVALMTGRFKGKPIQVHEPLGLQPKHFERWLQLFRKAAEMTCPPAAAAFFSDRAERIAESLRAGAARSGSVGVAVRQAPVAYTQSAVWSP